MLDQAKNRVRGTGVDRRDLPLACWLANFSSEDISEALLQDYSGNDFNEYTYRASGYFPLNADRPAQYRQTLFQTNSSSEIYDEYKYCDWRSPYADLPVISILRTPVRTRVAVLPPSYELTWHIDTNTSVACRFQLPLSRYGSVVEINRRGVVHQLHIPRGQLWFINTGWPHRVFNETEEDRVVLLCSAHSDDLVSARPDVLQATNGAATTGAKTLPVESITGGTGEIFN